MIIIIVYISWYNKKCFDRILVLNYLYNCVCDIFHVVNCLQRHPEVPSVLLTHNT